VTRPLSVVVALVLAALPLTACKEVETESSVSYEPTKLQAGKGDDAGIVTFTAEAAQRARVQTTHVARDGARLVVPYAALIYDEEGETFVFTSPKRLTFVRSPVEVERIEGTRVLLSRGPPPGTTVVTNGTAEVYGAEQEIAGSH